MTMIKTNTLPIEDFITAKDAQSILNIPHRNSIILLGYKGDLDIYQFKSLDGCKVLLTVFTKSSVEEYRKKMAIKKDKTKAFNEEIAKGKWL